MKTIYETPSVADLGTFEEITLGASTGTTLDFRAQPDIPAVDVFS